jgi:hypothetical protein
MYLKWRAGWLPAFEPYANLQTALGHLTGGAVHPAIPWALSFLNGSTIVGLVFSRLYSWLPGQGGALKGMTYGIIGWVVMGLVFFPLIDLGFFGLGAGLGIAPALFSLAMLLTYSLVMGMVYQALSSDTDSNVTSPPMADIVPPIQ